MDYEKFEWLVENSRLFMPHVDKLGDPFEGTTPNGELAWWNRKAENAESFEQRQIIEHNRRILSDMAKQFRNYYYISCWSMNKYENYAMWKCYAKSNNAVAVRSNYAVLRSLLPIYVEMGMVRYIDYATERLPSMNLFEYIMHKDIYYSHENEIRAVAASIIAKDQLAKHFNENHFELEKSPGFYVYAPLIDLKQLIKGVVLHPEIEADIKTRVIDLCLAKGLNRPELSRRAQEPVF
ncbi:hypothetical protein JXL19_07395 [bacterium]|nr:hypothetical protein [bacterium]